MNNINCIIKKFDKLDIDNIQFKDLRIINEIKSMIINMSKNVWIVVRYNQYEIDGIFTTKEKAIEYMKEVFEIEFDNDCNYYSDEVYLEKVEIF